MDPDYGTMDVTCTHSDEQPLNITFFLWVVRNDLIHITYCSNVI